MQQNEDYVLKVLQDVGLVTRKQVEGARSRLNGANNVVYLLIKDGIVSESDKFKKAMKQILSVPKKELERRELEYKQQRKIKSHRRHR